VNLRGLLRRQGKREDRRRGEKGYERTGGEGKKMDG